MPSNPKPAVAPVPSSAANFASLSVPALWPVAMAAGLVQRGTELFARNVSFINEEIKIHEELRPGLATANEVRLDLRTMRLRDYGKPSGTPTLVHAPYAGHTAMIADYQKGQSLVETLRNCRAHAGLLDPCDRVRCRRHSAGRPSL